MVCVRAEVSWSNQLGCPLGLGGGQPLLLSHPLHGTGTRGRHTWHGYGTWRWCAIQSVAFPPGLGCTHQPRRDVAPVVPTTPVWQPLLLPGHTHDSGAWHGCHARICHTHACPGTGDHATTLGAIAVTSNAKRTQWLLLLQIQEREGERTLHKQALPLQGQIIWPIHTSTLDIPAYCTAYAYVP